MSTDDKQIRSKAKQGEKPTKPVSAKATPAETSKAKSTGPAKPALKKAAPLGGAAANPAAAKKAAAQKTGAQGKAMPQAKAAPAKQAGAKSKEATKSNVAEERDEANSRSVIGAQEVSAVSVSAVVHLIFIMVFGLIYMTKEVPGLPPAIESYNTDDNPTEEMLDTEIETPDESEPTEAESAPTNFGAIDGAVGDISNLSNLPSPQAVAQQMPKGNPNVSIDDPITDIQDVQALAAAPSGGMRGEPRVVADNYADAMDRITQEILMLMAEQPVLVVWLFDQSESMLDDNKEIMDRISFVYEELGIRTEGNREQLATSICCYGKGFHVLTRRPTSDLDEIRAAMAPLADLEKKPLVDPSGKEMMCQAVMAAISSHIGVARKSRRRLALILVSDESGEPENNQQYLEQAVFAAKEAKAPVYILGREATFGYPYAHIEWRHPQSGALHYLPVDRGPETGFVEQLQTDGFRKRKDAHSSGFGPYEQSRLALETGGVFFMLPSIESKLHGRENKRRYRLESLRPFLPDLRSRQVLQGVISSNPLRATVTKIINDLNPYRKEVANVMEVSYSFSSKPAQFVSQKGKEQDKAKKYIMYLDAAAKALENIRSSREKELSVRWQANYDLIYAQILAYTARTYEYGVYLDYFAQNPKQVPPVRKKYWRHSGWGLQTSSRIIGGELTQKYIDASTEAFNYVIKQYPDSPYAERAKLELERGFGFDFTPKYNDYFGPKGKPSKPSGPRIPIPKL